MPARALRGELQWPFAPGPSLPDGGQTEPEDSALSPCRGGREETVCAYAENRVPGTRELNMSP